ncbi:3534_t:CDS:1 [Acaulospora morrowiae]|uniref:3534_t:CDS:1 n=1 Tax=Acaulospora morrowiae TaxID=94023 RepID=A0A9N9DXB3_9GLOM|nr:3534_t:CDS:1 [Acaulospora morrowiae]
MNLSNIPSQTTRDDNVDDEHIVNVEEIVLEKHIGKGTFGNVYKAVYRSEYVAVKIVKASDWTQVSKEIEIMKKFGDKYYHLIRYRGECLVPDGENNNMYILMDYAENGTLRDLLLNVTYQPTWALTIRLCYDIASGLSNLHELGIWHNDLKPVNILLDAGTRAKLCDFGSSDFDGKLNDRFCGTEFWAAPEALEDYGTTPYSHEKADIYSLGLIFCAIFHEGLSNIQEETTLTSIITERNTQLSPDVVQEPFNIGVQQLLHRDPQKRPPAHQVVTTICPLLLKDELGYRGEDNKMLCLGIPVDFRGHFILEFEPEDIIPEPYNDNSQVYKEIIEQFRIEFQARRGNSAWKILNSKEFSNLPQKHFYHGLMYYKGVYQDQDTKKALECWLEAADLGEPKSHHNIGLCYELGLGFEEGKNPEEAQKWYTKSPLSRSKWNLGILLGKRAQKSTGEQRQKLFEEYKSLVLNVAEQGDIYAMRTVAESYDSGELFEKDYEKSVFWFQKLADAGFTFALVKLAFAYGDGLGVEQDSGKAKELIEKAAQSADPDANMILSVEKNDEECIESLEKVARTGNPSAQFLLGEQLQLKYGNDHERALFWIRLAAEGGNTLSQKILGKLYLSKYDYLNAFLWFSKAAIKDEDSARNIAWFYEKGICVPHNYEVSRVFHRIAYPTRKRKRSRKTYRRVRICRSNYYN